jgi:hypothetical protein
MCHEKGGNQQHDLREDSMSPCKHLSMLAVRIYLLCLIGVAADHDDVFITFDAPDAGIASAGTFAFGMKPRREIQGYNVDTHGNAVWVSTHRIRCVTTFRSAELKERTQCLTAPHIKR